MARLALVPILLGRVLALQPVLQPDHIVDMDMKLDFVPADAPEWCRNKTEISWYQKKAKLDATETLKWAKKQAKLIEGNGDDVPKWMKMLVSADAKKGALRWAVQESTRLQKQGQEVPKWMLHIAEEDAKWGRKWSACKAAELLSTGKTVPTWMEENARKARMEAAEVELQTIEQRMDELERLKVSKRALLRNGGDKARLFGAMAATTLAEAVREKHIKEHTAELDKALTALASAKQSSSSLVGFNPLEQMGEGEKKKAVIKALHQAATSADQLSVSLALQVSAREIVASNVTERVEEVMQAATEKQPAPAKAKAKPRARALPAVTAG